MRTGTCERCGDPFVDRSHAQTRRFCSDNCRKRANDLVNRRVLCRTGCGRELWRRRGRSGLCFYCRADRQAKRERSTLVVAWWAEGLTLREIGSRLEWTVNHTQVEVHRLREAGYDLPYRRSAETVEHIRQGRRAAA